MVTPSTTTLPRSIQDRLSKQLSAVQRGGLPGLTAVHDLLLQTLDMLTQVQALLFPTGKLHLLYEHELRPDANAALHSANLRSDLFVLFSPSVSYDGPAHASAGKQLFDALTLFSLLSPHRDEPYSVDRDGQFGIPSNAAPTGTASGKELGKGTLNDNIKAPQNIDSGIVKELNSIPAHLIRPNPTPPVKGTAHQTRPPIATSLTCIDVPPSLIVPPSPACNMDAFGIPSHVSISVPAWFPHDRQKAPLPPLPKVDPAYKLDVSATLFYKMFNDLSSSQIQWVYHAFFTRLYLYARHNLRHRGLKALAGPTLRSSGYAAFTPPWFPIMLACGPHYCTNLARLVPSPKHIRQGVAPDKSSGKTTMVLILTAFADREQGFARSLLDLLISYQHFLMELDTGGTAKGLGTADQSQQQELFAAKLAAENDRKKRVEVTIDDSDSIFQQRSHQQKNQSQPHKSPAPQLNTNSTNLSDYFNHVPSFTTNYNYSTTSKPLRPQHQLTQHQCQQTEHHSRHNHSQKPPHAQKQLGPPSSAQNLYSIQCDEQIQQLFTPDPGGTAHTTMKDDDDHKLEHSYGLGNMQEEDRSFAMTRSDNDQHQLYPQDNEMLICDQSMSMDT